METVSYLVGPVSARLRNEVTNKTFDVWLLRPGSVMVLKLDPLGQ